MAVVVASLSFSSHPGCGCEECEALCVVDGDAGGVVGVVGIGVGTGVVARTGGCTGTTRGGESVGSHPATPVS